MDEMGIEVQNLFRALSRSVWSAEGKANELPELFSSLLGGLEEKKGEIPPFGQKGGELGSRSEEKGIEAWEALWKESPLSFFPKDKSLMGMKRPGGKQLSMDITSPFSRKRDFPLDLSPFGEGKNDPTRDEIPEGILETSLGPEKFAGEVPRTNEALPFGTRSSESELWDLMGLSSGEAIFQLNPTALGLEVYGPGPVRMEEDRLLFFPQKEISSSPFQARESSGLSDSISSATSEISNDKAQDGGALRALGLWAQIHGNGEMDKWDLGPSLGDPDALFHVVGPRIEGPRGPLSDVPGSFPFDTKNGKGARGQGAIGAIGVKEAGKLDASLVGFEMGDLSLPVIESLESSGQAKGPSSSPLEVAPRETSTPDMGFGVRDTKTEALQEGPPWEDDSSVSNQSFKTPSPVEDSRPELSGFPGVTEEKRSRGELATFKGPRRESPSIKREELGQSPEARPPEPGSLLSKDGPLWSPSKGETAQVNGSQRLFQPHGRELGEGPFQTIQIVFKEAEDLTRIRLRLYQNNLDALFVVTSAEKKSELEANLGQLQRELFQSGFLPQLAVEVGGRYANSGFQKDTPLYSHQESGTGGRDIHEEVLISGLNPLDGSIHLTV